MIRHRRGRRGLSPDGVQCSRSFPPTAPGPRLTRRSRRLVILVGTRSLGIPVIDEIRSPRAPGARRSLPLRGATPMTQPDALPGDVAHAGHPRLMGAGGMKFSQQISPPTRPTAVWWTCRSEPSPMPHTSRSAWVGSRGAGRRRRSKGWRCRPCRRAARGGAGRNASGKTSDWAPCAAAASISPTAFRRLASRSRNTGAASPLLSAPTWNLPMMSDRRHGVAGLWMTSSR